jgi:hypothetical protein
MRRSAPASTSSIAIASVRATNEIPTNTCQPSQGIVAVRQDHHQARGWNEERPQAEDHGDRGYVSSRKRRRAKADIAMNSAVVVLSAQRRRTYRATR